MNHSSMQRSRTGKKGPYAAYYIHFQPGACFVGECLITQHVARFFPKHSTSFAVLSQSIRTASVSDIVPLEHCGIHPDSCDFVMYRLRSLAPRG
jgi:hypothetical protein